MHRPMLPNPPQNQAQGDLGERRHRESSASKPSRTTNSILGDYTLTKKTLSTSSKGKVKLATHNITGEKFAVKIIPRIKLSVAPNTTNGVHDAPSDATSKRASKDPSREIYALREAALSMLLHHPYICGMREMIVHQNHYYMVLEYIDGEKMLDLIIRHGRLRERVARKFARQIGSALEYCHRNNVVHRDLKIENILISQTGNIKIIDFGLSNLYDPLGHLSTFCGSLYFSAPELLREKVYTGPEVDIWSFGIVLYILVCGKVPFDDNNVPALHAKIKRGLIEYPVWLSAGCKHLLSRMLAVDPSVRAPLSEVLNDPWMVQGFDGAPDTHLHREPLRVDELETQVIRGMTGFEFGSEEEIERQLVQILNSDGYQRAVQIYEGERIPGGVVGEPNLHGLSRSLPNSPLTISHDRSASSNQPDPPTTAKRNNRFSMFDFYRRKFKLSSPGSSPPGRQSPSQSHLPSSSQDRHIDPTKGYHPLISMYFLSREKLEREGIYGPRMPPTVNTFFARHPPRDAKPPPVWSMHQRSHSQQPTGGSRELGDMSGSESEWNVDHHPHRGVNKGKRWRRHSLPGKPPCNDPSEKDAPSNSDDSSNSAESRHSSMSRHSGKVRIRRGSASSHGSRSPGVTPSHKVKTSRTSHRAAILTRSNTASD